MKEKEIIIFDEFGTYYKEGTEYNNYVESKVKEYIELNRKRQRQQLSDLLSMIIGGRLK